MTTATHMCALRVALVYAHRVTVIPIADDRQLITIAGRRVGGLPRHAFPSRVKVHPRVRASTAAQRLLTADLGCQYTDLRLVAVLDPSPGFDREAVYTARVHWPAGRPEFAGCGRHRLQPIATADDARRLRLWPRRVAALLTGPDLAVAAAELAELLCTEPSTDASHLACRPAAASHG